jgi:PBP1b-binding outer membrane lipoprotein LpoB
MKKLVVVISLAILLVSCQTSAPQPTDTSAPTNTPIPLTPTNTPQPTFTPVPSTPTLEPISTLSEVSADSFIEYDSTAYISENGLSNRIPVFSVKYPPEWKYGWFGDSGIIA